jgi:hypothetical protein
MSAIWAGRKDRPHSSLLGRYDSHAGKDFFEEHKLFIAFVTRLFVGTGTTTHAESLPFALTKQTIAIPNPVNASSSAIQ